MQDYSESAIQSSVEAEVTYCKFIMPNDAGATGAHQAGFHIHKGSFAIAFDKPGEKGHNKDRTVKIKWQDDFETESRFIYYGYGTRNEYRLTRFGHDFPLLTPDSVGNLLILCKVSGDHYKGFVLETEDEIESYLNYFGISPTEANGLVSQITVESEGVDGLIEKYVKKLSSFPVSEEFSSVARSIYQAARGQQSSAILNDPDKVITEWVDTEYALFKAAEKVIYKNDIQKPFGDIDPLIKFANTVLNRRKSRAGKSLENHLAEVFDLHKLPYSAQKTTEGHKKPDFIIPSITLYHDKSYSSDKLVFLGAKTTCKDRWRQVLNEAARIPNKHLFTLQPGISSNQLREMKEENLTLVVPETNLSSFPPENREDILTLKTFIQYSKDRIS